MQDTSPLYREIIISENHWFEVSLVIGDGEADSGYREDTLMSLSTNHAVFNKNIPVVGSAVSGEIEVTMIAPASEIPKMAKLSLFVRATDGSRYSEWLKRGVYYIDTRYTSHNSNGLDVLTIHGYDSMLKFETDYPSDDQNNYPLLDTAMVQHIADSIGIDIDSRTFERMDCEYTFPLPVGYSSREMLGYIAGAYAGNFVITDENKLLLIKLGDLPVETNYLIDSAGNAITFGEDRPESTETYTGSIVSFLNYDEKTITGLVVNGSGNSTATVTRCGKNLLPNLKYQRGTQYVYLGQDTNQSYYNVHLKPETYTISCNNTVSASLHCKGAVMQTTRIASSATNNYGTLTVDTEDDYQFWLYSSGGISTYDVTEFQLELGSTASEYESYHGNTYTVQVGQTDHQVDALLGQNNIWADVGNVSVTVDTSASEATRILV